MSTECGVMQQFTTPIAVEAIAENHIATVATLVLCHFEATLHCACSDSSILTGGIQSIQSKAHRQGRRMDD